MSFQGLWSAIMDNKTLWVQIPIAVFALSLAAASSAFTVSTFRQERNAKLVEIGVAVLRADPSKEPSALAARKWALDLIDANAGVTFSPEARAELLKQALPAWDTSYYNIPSYDSSYYPTYRSGYSPAPKPTPDSNPKR